MKYYNAIIYWSYGSVGRYNDITSIDNFLTYFGNTNQLSAVKKIFFYRKENRKDYNGQYCGYWISGKLNLM